MRFKDDLKITSIFESTLKIVADVGLAGMNMAGVAKGAGLATGTIYRYFKSKEELLSALYQHVKVQFKHDVFEHDEAQESLKGSLRVVWTYYFMFLNDKKNESIFLQQFNRSPYIKNEENLRFALNVMEPLFLLFREGERLEVIRKDENKLFFPLFASFVEQCAFKAENMSEIERRKIILDGFELLWSAIKS